MRKCKEIGETASVEVAEEGLRMTRARTTLAAAKAAAEESTERKRKVRGGELEVARSEVPLKSMRVATVPDNSASPATSENLSCASISSIQVLAPCYSSRELSEVDKDSFNSQDLKNENEASVEEVATSTGDLVDCNESKEKTPSFELRSESGVLESTAKPHEVSSRRCPEAEKLPSEAELEEFFAAAEKDLQKKFIDKYNYDIVKDEPLEGRYEWVQLQVKP
ncbi:cyclin-dependent kinase inhibitor 7-like isoform X2 [Olea europaea var. sylvestris]|uniref:Cyclin-dependent kinase inhibitor 7-like isoform X1 n=1 Tax=Olea europaea subsp. europaea TaxID=158383 RepID=A0A8S0R979_OLEEU|nr:cyclin-dependent kinase inhibitor 7-like isoform X2 [Olea europaea var. sylvestris]CAA2975818.1 cyclin-dependent kinase inhibitor 7-like isoform X1 [Olea europaea subsp. europaea]